jgi:hypothetical protein
VIDNMRFVNKKAGGLALLEWTPALLRPRNCIALQHHQELESVLAPLRKEASPRVIDLPIALHVRKNSREERISR